ncbi:hypothetical protein KQI89_08830 [Clostridium sp. MSJ-4]|uniref:Uncharacterized protein n=1 Tax=Clostridium simiarum TaxID=2841506 RepID=A0ABS6F037_9CLOT|nr:hypothetical protein [Clostridium simiarum]MBU5591869.1 hypothetical protein [Clostridium simiarum]
MLNIFSFLAIVFIVVAVVFITVCGKNTKILKIRLLGLFNVEVENYKNQKTKVVKKEKTGASTPVNSKKE